MIEFHLDTHSGVATYLQIVQQVKQALRLGRLQVGDQLPTVREVVAQITINPNTVLGTFVQRTLASTSLASHAALRRSLVRWLQSASEAGLDGESVLALFMSTFQDTQKEETA